MADFTLRLEEPPHLRDVHDPKTHWATPAKTTRALLNEHPPPTRWVIEPSAGEGAIVAELLTRGYSVAAIEVRDECVNGLCEMIMESRGIGFAMSGDWIEQDPFKVILPEDQSRSVVGNPPWSPSDVMLAHVEHSLSPPVRYVAMLLPLVFLCSKGRRGFWRRHPLTALYPLVERPKFHGGGGQQECAWFVWDRTFTETHGSIQIVNPI